MDRLVVIPNHEGLFASFKKNFAGIIIDFFPLLLIILWDLLFILRKGDFTIFILVQIFLIILNLISLYFVFIKFNLIEIITYDIPVNKDRLKDSFRFAFVSDIHMGYRYEATTKQRLMNIINRLNSLDVDLIVFGGDFLAYALDKDLLVLLKDVKCKVKVGVYGNHDSYYEKEKFSQPKEFLEIMKETGIKLLINDCITFEYAEDKITFAGIPDLYSKNFNIIDAFKKCPENNLRILISHNPDIIDFVHEEDKIDLILSGHSHSGQIFFPIVGPILPMPTKRKTFSKGLFQIGKSTKLFLSQGVGHSGSRLRIGTKNEICIINLFPD